MVQYEIRADEVKPGDYLPGLGWVQSKTTYGKRVTLRSEGNDWKVMVDARHRVIVSRDPDAS